MRRGQDQHRDIRPWRFMRGFDTTACSPACSGVVCASKSGSRRLDITHRNAAGYVRQEPIESVAEAAARSAKPVIAGLASGNGNSATHGAAADAAPVDVALETEHGLSHLPIVAN